MGILQEPLVQDGQPGSQEGRHERKERRHEEFFSPVNGMGLPSAYTTGAIAPFFLVFPGSTFFSERPTYLTGTTGVFSKVWHPSSVPNGSLFQCHKHSAGVS